MFRIPKLKSFFSTDIGIDLGTANSLVYAKDRGVVLREPSVVAIQAGSKRVLAVGEEAKRMLGRTPGNIVAIRPMKSGVIADFDITEAMIAYFINKVCPKRFWSKYAKPRMVIAVPSGITEVEKRAVEDAAHADRRRHMRGGDHLACRHSPQLLRTPGGRRRDGRVHHQVHPAGLQPADW